VGAEPRGCPQALGGEEGCGLAGVPAVVAAAHQSPLMPARVQTPKRPAMTTTREQILAASAGWVAVLLNLFPDVGNGYLYQRRWKAY